MRHSFFCFTAAVFSAALSLTSCSSSAASADAQPSSELKAFDVRSEWKRNPFTFFDGDGLLLAVGKKDNMNAMTIGWGQLGSLWGMDSPVVTVFVRKSRYTDAFMAKNDYFTVSGFSSKFSDALRYMGTHSGREGDKVKATGLRVEYAPEHPNSKKHLQINCSTKLRPQRMHCRSFLFRNWTLKTHISFFLKLETMHSM